MNKVKMHFIGGTNIEFTDCDNETVENLNKWLTNDKLKIFIVNTVKENRSTSIRKENLLFIDIVKGEE